MSLQSSTISVGLLWHSPSSSNLGVGALTFANIALIREAAKRANVSVTFKMIGYVDNNPHYLQDPEVEIIRVPGSEMVTGSAAFLQSLKSCQVIFDSGAGDSFASIYGWKRLMFLLASKWRAAASGNPLILSPQTIGPFDSAWSRFFARKALKRAAVVFARDEMSLDFCLKDLKNDPDKTRLSTDVAFALPYDEIQLDPIDRPRVGINVSGLLFSGGYTQNNQFDLSFSFREFIEAYVDWLLDQDCEVHFINHVISKDPLESDTEAGRILAEGRANIVVAPQFEDPRAVKGYIAQLDFFAGARMHACIAAVSTGVACAPLAYSRKFAGLFGSLGFNRTIDMRKTTLDEALAAAKKAYQERDQVKAEIEPALTEAKKRLEHYIDPVRDILTNLS